MTFQPVVPLGGLAGWRFLERTLEGQQAAFNESTPVSRATDYFRENIGKINTAEQLVADRQLLTVALGAFGLSDDINNKFFIQKVLEDGSLQDDALANRLSDKRYLDITKAFGFGDFDVPRIALSTFADEIIERFQSKSFEVAVGNVNEDMRLALNLKSSIEEISNNNQANDTKWFTILGNPPLRTVMETAIGLPSSIGAVDLDLQLEAFKDASQRSLGTDDVTDFGADDVQDRILELFLFRSQIQAGQSLTGSSAALTLLSQIA